VLNIELIIHSVKRIRSFNNLSEDLNLNNAQNVNFGSKEYLDVRAWHVDVGLNSVMIVVVLDAHMVVVRDQGERIRNKIKRLLINLKEKDDFKKFILIDPFLQKLSII
jgi:hypothetical protein